MDKKLKTGVNQLLRDTDDALGFDQNSLIAIEAIKIHRECQIPLDMDEDTLHSILMLHNIIHKKIPIEYIEERFGSSIAHYVFAISTLPNEDSNNEYYDYNRIGHNLNYAYVKMLLEYAKIRLSIIMKDRQAFINYINKHERTKRLMRTYFGEKLNAIFNHGSLLMRQGKVIFKNG